MKVYKLQLVLAVALLPLTIQAQNTPVEFRVNMNHYIETNQFDPATEFVDIAGTLNNWGNPGGSFTDPDQDGIYSYGTFLEEGSTILFKSRINGEWAGREEFPGGGPNRTYVVEPNGVVEFWYNDELPDYILAANIGVSNAYVKPGETVYFEDLSNGSPTTWQWQFEGGTPATSTDQNPTVTYANTGRYDVWLTVTNDSGDTAVRHFEDYMRVDEQETFWWNDAVFYEIFVRSYRDSDGDGIGDFQGLIDNLDYLNDGDPETDTDLGVTGIWLMPIQQSPSYHGYDVVDYRTIEQDYGSNADFQAFMQAAHDRGIRVIIDLVMNHTSSQSPWFQQSQNNDPTYRDWYVWRPNHPNYNGPWGQPVWHQSGGEFFYGVFWSGMPDLNYNTQAVKDEVFDIARFWLEDMDVDGFRLDAVKFIYEENDVLEDTESTLQFWKDFRAYYKSVAPESFSVGEAWTSTDKVADYVNGDGLDYCFEFDLASAMLNAVNAGNGEGLENQMNTVMAAYPYLQFGSFLTNHDINRVMSILGEEESKAKLAANLLLTLPGIPYIYYGEEIGMTGEKPDQDIRTPLQWNGLSQAGFTTGIAWHDVNADYTTKNIENQQADPSSLWSTYRNLIHLRNQEVALRQGGFSTATASRDEAFAFLRQRDDENVLVAANLSDTTLTNLLVSMDQIGLNNPPYQGLDLLTGAVFDIDINANQGFTDLDLGDLGPRETRIIRLLDADLVGLEDKKPPVEVAVFPVPSRQTVSIQVIGGNTAPFPYQIVDMTGRLMQTGTVPSTGLTLDVQQWPNGVYFFQGTDQPLTRKMVVQH